MKYIIKFVLPSGKFLYQRDAECTISKTRQGARVCEAKNQEEIDRRIAITEANFKNIWNSRGVEYRNWHGWERASVDHIDIVAEIIP